MVVGLRRRLCEVGPHAENQMQEVEYLPGDAARLSPTVRKINHPTFDPLAVSSATSSIFGVLTATSKNSLPRQIQIGGRLVF